MMLPQEIIRAKRDGETLSAGEIGDFIAALTSGSVSEDRRQHSPWRFIFAACRWTNVSR
jgi:thymidine phosphorylase